MSDGHRPFGVLLTPNRAKRHEMSETSSTVNTVSGISAERPPGADLPDGDSGDSILEATMRLLEEMPLHDVSVAKIMQEAGVARATFYAYFDSKHDVAATLLARVMDEIHEGIEPFLHRGPDVAPREALRASLAAGWQTFMHNQPLMRATSEHWHAEPALREMWLDVIDRFSADVAAEIDRERAAGLAVPGTDSKTLAAMLLWSTERCMHVAGMGVDPKMPSQADMFDPLLEMWLRTIYGDAAPAR
jgi:AcrR family transcriptional regulator